MHSDNIHIGDYWTGHIQGIAVDKKREYIYCSFTTCLVKSDMNGNVVGSVKGLAGHLGCIAYNEEDGRVYGSLEYKHDKIGQDILDSQGNERDVEDGFYMVAFDIDKIDRMDMDAEQDGIMTAVYLKEVLDDYTAEGHRYGCSGIDGTTFAPLPGKSDGKKYLYVSYGIYGDVERIDNDYQVILRYDISEWKKYEKALNQADMHRCGPEKPDDKYFVYTGNTRYGIQNLEYDPVTNYMFATVYAGRKEQFPNYDIFVIDLTKQAKYSDLRGLSQEGKELFLAEVGELDEASGVRGYYFPYGATGIISLGDGCFYFSQNYKNENGYGTNVKLYQYDVNKGFQEGGFSDMETRWLHVTSEELPALREASKGVCVIPMGCVEKHGLHLPLGTDILEASALVYEASKKETFTVFPDFTFGDVPENYPTMPVGSITLPVETEMLLLEQLCEQIARNGYKKIVVYNGHGGNRPWLSTFLRKLENKPHNYVVCVIYIGHAAPHTMAEIIEEQGSEAVPELNEEDIKLLQKYHEAGMKLGHACFCETSYIMGSHPDSVHLDRLGIEDGQNRHVADKYKEHGIDIRDGGWWVNRPNAYSGDDPYGCNERIGKAAVRIEAERLAASIKFLKEDDDLLKWHNEAWNTNL